MGPLSLSPFVGGVGGGPVRDGVGPLYIVYLRIEGDLKALRYTLRNVCRKGNDVLRGGVARVHYNQRLFLIHLCPTLSLAFPPALLYQPCCRNLYAVCGLKMRYLRRRLLLLLKYCLEMLGRDNRVFDETAGGD